MMHMPPSPRDVVAHLTPDIWTAVNTRLVVKSIAEFSHELLLRPTLLGTDGKWGHYVLSTDRPSTEYRFRAQLLELDHWLIDDRSVQKSIDGRPAPLDAVAFIVELCAELKIPSHVLPGYLEEIASTLSSAAYKRWKGGPTATALTQASFQEVEAAMTEGHPTFVANNARLGFNAVDYRAYAPEAAEPVHLHWLAAHKRRAEFACVDDLTYDELLRQELDPMTLELFATKIRQGGGDPAFYVLIPVHPWQWENRIAQLFAADIAGGDVVHLGCGEDAYQAQQSIRTFYNVSRPDRRYVKTALSIVNMGFTRGLSASLAQSGAAINQWVAELVKSDAYLRGTGFTLLREVAFVGYRHRYYERANRRRNDPHKEMLAALWRENPTACVGDGERLMTMAALMHLDHGGKSVMKSLVDLSGVTCIRCCTAFMPTTSFSPRTARTSFWCCLATGRCAPS